MVFNLIQFLLPMPEPTPVPVCPIHSTFMVPCTPEEIVTTLPGLTGCSRCANLDCELFYVHGGGATEGYYKLDANGELKRR